MKHHFKSFSIVVGISVGLGWGLNAHALKGLFFNGVPVTECGTIGDDGDNQTFVLKTDLTFDPSQGNPCISIAGVGNTFNLNRHSITGDPQSTGFGRGFCVELTGANSTVKNGTLEGCRDGISDHLVQSPGNGHLIKHLQIKNINVKGISLEGDNITVVDNKIIRTGEEGIDMGGNNNKVLSNHINQTKDEGIDIDGINNTISRNRIRNTFAGIDIGNSNNTVTKNLVQDTETNGIELRGSKNSFSYNTIVDADIGFFFRGLANDNIISKNSIFGSKSFAIGALNLSPVNPDTGNVIKFNVIWHPKKATDPALIDCMPEDNVWRLNFVNGFPRKPASPIPPCPAF